ncbi:hypothetical protein Ancab_012531 [Ancistrocladus abbreviatus]
MKSSNEGLSMLKPSENGSGVVKAHKLTRKICGGEGGLEVKCQKLFEPPYAKWSGQKAVSQKKCVLNFADCSEDKVSLAEEVTNEVLAKEMQIIECDEGALKFLKVIKWCRIDNPQGLSLRSFLTQNCNNTVLSKTYQ